MLSLAMSARRLTLASPYKYLIPKVPPNSHQALSFDDVVPGITSLEKLMREFSAHHKSTVTPAGYTPKTGELVSAKFSDGAWYRAKIRRSSPVKKEAEVTFIDYGNQDTIGFKDIRPLDPKFRSLPGQAHDARLR
jgi:staphylococcal nuclease domain-containing protein 1